MGITPTTKAQVSGHRFLARRIEHGLVLGDIRMIHDPLAQRRRALAFGLSACALVAVGAVAMAVFAPAVDPSQAPILQADNGQLFVRVDDHLHPVTNIASARLIAGEALAPQPVSDAVLATLPHAAPVGIVDAPGLATTTEAPDDELTAHACWIEPTLGGRLDDHSPELHVVVHPAHQPQRFAQLRPTDALVAVGDGREWLITSDGRRELPAADSVDGRIIRRRLAIGPATPRWELPPQLLSAIVEKPPVAPPTGVIEIMRVAGVDSGAPQYWARTDAGVAEVSAIQADILADLGTPVQPQSAADVAEFPDAPVNLTIPDSSYQWVDPHSVQMCVTNDGGVDTRAGGDTTTTPHGVDTTVRLTGESAVATHFSGPGYAVGVDTGTGVHVVSAYGVRHQLDTPDTVDVLGISPLYPMNWDILRLLPSGTTLSAAEALQPVQH